MTMRFVTKKAMCLAVSIMAMTAPAHADSGYSPYYSEDAARDSYQFAEPSVPMTSGVSTPAPAPIIAEREVIPPEPALFHMNNEFWASAGTSFYNYKESVAPTPDSEHGWLPSVAAGVDFMTHNNLYLALEGSDSLGDAHYNGAEFVDDAIPLEATTHETIYTVDGTVGQGFYATNNVMLIPYVNVGYRYWDRNLGAQQPQEDYHDFDALAGLKLEVAPTDRILLSAYASGGTTLGSRMSTSGSTFNLSDSAMEKVGGKIGLELTKQVELFTTLDYDHFHYGSSGTGTTVINNQEYYVLEPGSATNDTTVRVGIGYHFR